MENKRFFVVCRIVAALICQRVAGAWLKFERESFLFMKSVALDKLFKGWKNGRILSVTR